MGLRINTNIQALNAHKNLTRTDGLLSKSLERLSSGLRINKAADDGSGLTIADNLRAQHTGIGQAIANASDAVNIIQIADGALEESINIVNTIRTKSIQSASDGQDATSRAAIQADINKLLEELEMIGDTTAYNGVALLDGSFINKSFHVGAYKDEIIGLSIDDARGSKVGGMAYAKTDRMAEATVSAARAQGMAVNAEGLVDGDLRLNGITVGSTKVNVATYGSTDSAWAKAAAINDKINDSGAQAKATTEAIIKIGAGYDISTKNIALNGLSLAVADGITTAAALASVINNGSLATAKNIRAEVVDTDEVRVIADDGRNLHFSLGNGLSANNSNGFQVNGNAVGFSTATNATLTLHGSLTLTNAQAMARGDKKIASGSINAGDVLINSIDIARGGSLVVEDNDTDFTLLNAINGNEDLQRLGIRAELFSLDAGTTIRMRLISESYDITVSGNDVNSKAGLVAGTTNGTKTNGVILQGKATDSDETTDNYLVKVGFLGTYYGTFETSGVNNSGGNDTLAASRNYTKFSNVDAQSLADGDIRVNNETIGSSKVIVATYGSTDSAWSKAAAINDKMNDTGVQARAITEAVIKIGAAYDLSTKNIALNGLSLAVVDGITTAAQLASVINNGSLATSKNITAQVIDADELRVVANDGRNLHFSLGNGLSANNSNGFQVNGNAVGFSTATNATLTLHGALTLSNSQAMARGDKKIASGTLSSGDLTINGVDISSSGSLTIKDNDSDFVLLNAINNNEELQKMGIRAEKFSLDGGTTIRMRIISERQDVTIAGTDPNSLSGLVAGTTAGTQQTSLEVRGAATDTNATDNYLTKIGMLGTFYGTTETNGVDNTGGNDWLVIGKDRLTYDSGDIKINDYDLATTISDGLSDILDDKSAAAWANAVNLVKTHTGVEADIIKASQAGAGAVTAGTLQQQDLVINGIDIVRDNTGGSGMAILAGDAGNILVDAINEYKSQTGVIASVDADGKLLLDAIDGRNIHVASTANGNTYVKFNADFGTSGVSQDSVYFGNIRLVSASAINIEGSGYDDAGKEMSLLKVGLDGGGASTEATSDLKGDGIVVAGVNYDTAISNVNVTTQEGAEMGIRSADYALKRLDAIRAGLGSTQNQMTSTITNLSVTKINVQATESSIRDVDFAAESTQFSKMQVLMQAGTFAQAQANATAQSVLSLLQ